MIKIALKGACWNDGQTQWNNWLLVYDTECVQELMVTFVINVVLYLLFFVSFIFFCIFYSGEGHIVIKINQANYQ